MSDNHQLHGKNKDGVCPFLSVVCGGLAGALLSAGIYWITELQGVWLFVVPGVLIGIVIGFYWRVFVGIWTRSRLEEWQVTEIEIETLGQKWKLASSGSQRRVAWALFVETATRIATQPMADADGDDGIALKSLYDLFQSTRKIIAEMELTHLLPSKKKHTDTVETFALAMLNQDLRPFLSKWHPVWDVWRKANPDVQCMNWNQHAAFRDDLRTLQPKIHARAEGLAKIAGISDIKRLLDVS